MPLGKSPCIGWSFTNAIDAAEREESHLMNSLTSDEQSQLRLIVENAHREGWIQAGASLSAEHAGSSVRVVARSGSNVVERTYPHDDRWAFRLLRDLAWGTYRSWGSPVKPAGK
jgi:hypothetical protein